VKGIERVVMKRLTMGGGGGGVTGGEVKMG
jgi:hypothetical protein